MKLAKVDVGRNRPSLQNAEQMFCLRFDQRTRANRIQGMIFDCALPAFLRWTKFGFDDFIHRVLPGSLDNQRVARHQISAGDLEIDRRLFVGFVSSVEETVRNGFVACFQAFLFSVDPVFNEEDSATFAEQSVTQFHLYPHGC